MAEGSTFDALVRTEKLEPKLWPSRLPILALLRAVAVDPEPKHLHACSTARIPFSPDLWVSRATSMLLLPALLSSQISEQNTQFRSRPARNQNHSAPASRK